MSGKNKILRLLMVAAAIAIAAAVSSCVKLEKTKSAPERIGFQAVVAKPSDQTKAVVEGEVYPKTTPFKAVAYYDTGDGIRAGSEIWVPESKVEWIDAAGKWGIMDGGSEKVFKWPMVGTFTAMGYSPAEMTYGTGTPVNLTMGTEGVALNSSNFTGAGGRGWDSEQMKGVDFMVADLQNKLDASGSSNGVPMIFRHMLTKVRISAKRTLENTDEVKIKSIKIKNVATQADFSAGMVGAVWGHLISDWRNHALKKSVNFYENALGFTLSSQFEGDLETGRNDNNYLQVGEPYLAIPQDLDASYKIVVDYSVTPKGGTEQDKNAEVQIYLFHDEWEKSKDVHYKFEFGPRQMINFDCTAGPWSVTVGGGLIYD